MNNTVTPEVQALIDGVGDAIIENLQEPIGRVLNAEEELCVRSAVASGFMLGVDIGEQHAFDRLEQAFQQLKAQNSQPTEVN